MYCTRCLRFERNIIQIQKKKTVINRKFKVFAVEYEIYYTCDMDVLDTKNFVSFVKKNPYSTSKPMNILYKYVHVLAREPRGRKVPM